MLADCYSSELNAKFKQSNSIEIPQKLNLERNKRTKNVLCFFLDIYNCLINGLSIENWMEKKLRAKVRFRWNLLKYWHSRRSIWIRLIFNLTWNHRFFEHRTVFFFNCYESIITFLCFILLDNHFKVIASKLRDEHFYWNNDKINVIKSN